jgi:divalent metal cation (Fe/Co/Zn/Cd) transporter
MMKYIAGFWIGTGSIISGAIHSSMNLIAAVIAFIPVRNSAEPPDARYEFGHG